ncbi:carbohydrate esterase family 4 protein [Moniliophthora roreri]|nr:carbohydrate esterase family 4 protein [Moniliophthora roreri]
MSERQLSNSSSGPSSVSTKPTATDTAQIKPTAANTTHASSSAVKPEASNGAVPVYPGAALSVLLPLAVAACL